MAQELGRAQRKSNGRGKTRPAASGESKHRRRGHGGSSARWDDVDGAAIVRAITVVAADGGALRFGYTRDGGALALGVYGDGEPYTEYFRDVSDAEEFLGELAEVDGASAEQQLELPGVPPPA